MIADIVKTLKICCEPGKVYELRVPKTKRRGVISGYFDDISTLAVNADTLSDDPDTPAVYLTLNPVNPALLGRAANETIDRAEITTRDHEISQRRGLLIDCDPKRPAGISSSDIEHNAAIERSRQIRAYLTGVGFPLSVLADSGNGGHNVYRIDLPAGDESADLVKRFLESLSSRFSDDKVSVDTTVWNASRINKLYGTMTRKGANTPDRPHRRSRILECPDVLEVVPVELLKLVAGEPKSETPKSETKTGPKPNNSETTRKKGPHTPESVESFMTEKGWSFKPSKPWNGGLLWELSECPHSDEHTTGPGGAAVTLVDGVRGFRCQHDHCSERHARDIFGSVGSSGKSPTITQTLVKIATDNADLWRGTDGAVWATVEVDGHSENWPVQSSKFRHWMVGRYWELKCDAPNDKALKGAVDVIEHKASRGAEHRVYLRYARLSDRLYIDLGGPKWNAIEITADGWKVISQPSVKFRRSSNMAELPAPQVGGKVDLLKKVIPVSDSGFVLVLGCLLDAMKGHGPYFITSIHGEQGSAKSSLCRILRRLVDPLVKVELSALPRDEEALAVDGKSEYMLAYDNVSYLASWLSDAFCRVATGGGIKKRTNYTNDDQHIIGVCAPVVLNGIPDYAEANDLLGRSLLVRLPRIPDEARRDEADVFGEFETIRPLVFGALLDMVSAGLKRLPTVKLPSLPRMADSVKWVQACLNDETFLTEYANNLEEAAEVGFESSPIAEVVVRLVHDAGGTWKGTSQEMLDDLTLKFPDRVRQKDFPKTARALSGRLKRDAPALRSKGVDYEARKTGGFRWVRLEVIPNTTPPDNQPDDPKGDGRGTVGTVQNPTVPPLPSPPFPLKNKQKTGGGDGRDGSLPSLEKMKEEEVEATVTPDGGGGCSERPETTVPTVPTVPNPSSGSENEGTVGGDAKIPTVPTVPPSVPTVPPSAPQSASGRVVQPEATGDGPPLPKPLTLARNLMLEWNGGWVVMPKPSDLETWKWGRQDEDGNTTFSRGEGTKDWAIGEVRSKIAESSFGRVPFKKAEFQR